MSDAVSEEFQMLAGRRLTVEFADCLVKALGKEPAFAAADCADAVLALEALLKSQTNANEISIEIACSTFATALYNANTDYKCNVVYEKED